MGTISTSIQLIDRVSAPVNNMISALDSVCSAFESVDRSMDGAFDTASINSARQSIAAAQEQLVMLGNEQDNYTNAVKRSENGLIAMAGKLFTAYASFKSIMGMIGMSDQMAQVGARLDMLGDKLQVTQEQIMGVAQRSRSSFTDTADVISKLGQRAGDAFNNGAELLQFGENLNKMFIIAGASQAEMNSASLQLTQALGSGVLRGEEFNAVFESAPNIIKTIADYLGVPIGEIRNMASEGKITADIVKNAMLSATNDINEQYEKMPMTWAQSMEQIKNVAQEKFQPVFNKINELANNQGFQVFAVNAVNALSTIALVLVDIMEFSGKVVGFIKDNWSIITPIVLGITTVLGLYTAALLYNNTVQAISNGLKAVAAFRETVHAAALMKQTGATFKATAAQYGLNAALLAFPITWILVAIIAAIAAFYAVVAAINKVTNSTISATGSICGAIATLGAFIWNTIVGVINAIIQFLWTNFAEPWINVIEWILNVFNGGFNSFGDAVANLIGNIISWFLSLGKVVTKIIDAIFGTNWTAGLSSLQNEITNWGKNENAITLDRNAPTIDARIDYGTAWDSGYSFGDNIANNISNIINNTNNTNNSSETDIKNIYDNSSSVYGNGYDSSQIPENIAATAENTGKTIDSLEITSEDLKYLNDITEREVINRFTTAEIKVEMGGINNNVSSNVDLDGTVNYLVTTVKGAMEKAAEGVHD